MTRSRSELEDLVRALEIAWAEQSGLAHAYQQEATELWRMRAEQDRMIAELGREIEALRGGGRSVRRSAPKPAIPSTPLPDADALRDRIARQRETIALRKRELAPL